MMTAEERIRSLHERMNAMQRAQERRKTKYFGMGSAVLFVCLLVMVFGGGTAHPGGTVGLYSGTTMLFENAGAYVLAAVIAFMVGVFVTVLLLRSRKKNGEIGEEADLTNNQENV